MRIYTKAGDLAFKTFTFPDGQPHFKLETYEREFDEVTIETAIANCNDLFTLGLVVGTLRASGYASIALDIRYLLGARMDRAIGWDQPFTLALVASFLNSLGLSRVRILDVHSDVALRLIRNSENVLPFNVVNQVYTAVGLPCVVTPDKGAVDRVNNLMQDWTYPWAKMLKCRNTNTGELQGFTFKGGHQNVVDRDCIIIDDICDGGGTFVGIAKLLKQAGAKKVYLYVTHGIFSKGLPLEEIDRVFTTDSYVDPFWATRGVTVIPVSMKEMK